MKKVIMFIIVLLTLLSVFCFGIYQQVLSSSANSSIGFELKVSVKAHVERSINATIAYKGGYEDFGACGRANYGKGPVDGGATVAGGGNLIGGKVEVIWGIDCEDYMEQDHSVFFDTSKFLSIKNKIRSVVFEYHDNGKWIMKLYDKLGKPNDRKLLGEDTVIEPWRQRQWVRPKMLEISFNNSNLKNIYISTIYGDYITTWGNYVTRGLSRSETFLDIGRKFILQWGVKGSDGNERRRKVIFDTMKFYNIKDSVKSVEFAIDGYYCTIQLYDMLQGETDRKLLGQDKQKYTWLEGIKDTPWGVAIPIPEGYELSVTCNPEIDADPNIPSEIKVSVIADGYEEEFGLIESQLDKKTGKRIYCSRIRAYWPFEIGKDFDIVWSDIDNSKYTITVPTKEFVDVKEKAKALELVYESGKKWKIKLYDNLITKEGRQLLKELVVTCE